ncbi:MAG TPA: hypothetical protein VFV82_06550 [Candidatus Binatia bacterium]|nr:hypothetical protein [Candidatus Binatia bacterium]
MATSKPSLAALRRAGVDAGDPERPRVQPGVKAEVVAEDLPGRWLRGDR